MYIIGSGAFTTNKKWIPRVLSTFQTIYTKKKVIMIYVLKYDTQESFSGAENSNKYVKSIVPGVSLTEENEKSSYNRVIRNNGYGYVDLDLPSETLWATCNVGATTPSQYGNLFYWASTTPGAISDNYTDYPYFILGDTQNPTFTKYTSADTLVHLEICDDAARANMGGAWHIPTFAQVQELYDNCDHVSEGSGIRFYSKKDHNKSIYLPPSNASSPGTSYLYPRAIIWTNERSDPSYGYARAVGFYSGNFNATGFRRAYMWGSGGNFGGTACYIRPVID